MAYNFPTLTSFKTPIDVKYEDIVLKSTMEAGYQLTRPRFTKNRRTFKISWDLVASEMTLFESFYEDVVYGTDKFNINFSLNGKQIKTTVIFASVPKIVYNGMGVWELECEFVEV